MKKRISLLRFFLASWVALSILLFEYSLLPFTSFFNREVAGTTHVLQSALQNSTLTPVFEQWAYHYFTRYGEHFKQTVMQPFDRRQAYIQTLEATPGFDKNPTLLKTLGTLYEHKGDVRTAHNYINAAQDLEK